MASDTSHTHLGLAALDDEEDLSNEQMKALLQRAEKRIRAADTAETSSDDIVHLQDSFYAGNAQPMSKIPRLNVGGSTAPYVSWTNGIAQVNARRLIRDRERNLSNEPRRAEDPVHLRGKKMKKATAGSGWFDLPRTNLTSDLKRDLQLLKMRDVLDPKRHYKKNDAKTLAPEFSQIGTVVEGSTEFFSSRVPNKERKRTLVEEVLKEERSTSRFKSKYRDIQAFKTSGKKAFYRSLKEKRRHNVRKG